MEVPPVDPVVLSELRLHKTREVLDADTVSPTTPRKRSPVVTALVVIAVGDESVVVRGRVDPARHRYKHRLFLPVLTHSILVMPRLPSPCKQKTRSPPAGG